MAFACNAIASTAVLVHLIAFIVDSGRSLGVAAATAGMVGALQVAGRILLLMLGNRVPLRTVAAVVFGLKPVSLVALLVFPGDVALIVFVICFGASNGAATLIRPSFVADIFGREPYATIAGVLTGFVATSAAIAPVGGGIAFDARGSYQPLFWVFVGLTSIATCVVLLVREEAMVGNRTANPVPTSG